MRLCGPVHLPCVLETGYTRSVHCRQAPSCGMDNLHLCLAGRVHARCSSQAVSIAHPVQGPAIQPGLAGDGHPALCQALLSAR